MDSELELMDALEALTARVAHLEAEIRKLKTEDDLDFDGEDDFD